MTLITKWIFTLFGTVFPLKKLHLIYDKILLIMFNFINLNFLLIFLLIISHIVFLLLFFLLHKIVVFDQHVKVEPNHQKQTVGLLLFHYQLPTLLFSQYYRLLKLLLRVDKVFVNPNEVDFEELNRNLYLDF